MIITRWQADVAMLIIATFPPFMWDDQVCPKTTAQIRFKCFLMTSRFGEIYRAMLVQLKLSTIMSKIFHKNANHNSVNKSQVGLRAGKQAEKSSHWFNTLD